MKRLEQKNRYVKAEVWAVLLVLSLGFWNPAGVAFAQPMGKFMDITSHLGDGFDLGGRYPGISPDDLTLFISSGREPSLGQRDIFQAKRDKVDGPFGEPTPLGAGVNSPSQENGPEISADGRTLYFASDRSGDSDIYRSTWDDEHASFGIAVPLGPNVNTASGEGDPNISGDGLMLLFYSGRPESFGFGDIWVSERSDVNEPFGPAVNFNDFYPGSQVNTSEFGEFGACLSANRLALFFTDGVEGGPFRAGDWSIWVAVRGAVDEPFGAPVDIDELTLGSEINIGNNLWPAVSADWPAAGSRLYFASDRTGGARIFEATWVHLEGCELAPGISGPDCNDNGFLDECEIAGGLRDVDQNGTPDVCEPDCNDNRVPDDFETREGAAADCNINGVPDACEPDGNGNDIPDDCEANFIRGDCDGDGEIVIHDGIFLLNFLFAGRRAPVCAAACDIERTGELGVTSATRIFGYLFLGARKPLAPFPDCGPPRKADAVLGCAMSHAHCE